MEAAITKLRIKLYHYIGSEKVDGACSGLYGDCSDLYGDCSGLYGDCSGLYGDCSGLYGDFDNCDISKEDREKGVCISMLIKIEEVKEDV